MKKLICYLVCVPVFCSHYFLAHVSNNPLLTDWILVVTSGDKVRVSRDIIDEGLSINELYDGKTLLNIALKMGRIETATSLLKLGADSNKADKNGDRPLVFAIMQADPMLIELLLKYGADPSLQFEPADQSIKDFSRTVYELYKNQRVFTPKTVIIEKLESIMKTLNTAHKK